MYLLNSSKILEYSNQSPFQDLHIKYLSEDNLNPSSYYFRIGNHFSENRGDKWQTLSEKNQTITIQPNQLILVTSLESFRLSKRVFGIIGPSTDMQKYGLRILYGQFIDPMFDGHLEIGIHNPFNESISIKFKETLGKVCFFDVSDTYPILDNDAHSVYKKKFKRRKEMKKRFGIPEWAIDEDVVAFAREKEQQEKFD